MYCEKCGKQIEENVRFCPACGSAIGSTTPIVSINNNSNRNTMFIVWVLAVVVSMSSFIKMYAIDLNQKTSFSVYNLLDKTSEVYRALSNLGIHLNFSSSSSMNSGSKDLETLGMWVLGVIIFTLVMYFVSLLEIVVGLIYNISYKSENEGKFWKSTVSASMAAWIANLIVWGIFMIINAAIKEKIGQIGIITGNLIIISPIHYIIQIFAVIIYLMSHVKYSSLKKAKKNSQR